MVMNELLQIVMKNPGMNNKETLTDLVLEIK